MGASSQPSIEDWAEAYIRGADFASKLAPTKPPAEFRGNAAPLRAIRPGRGPQFRVSEHGIKSSGKRQLASVAARARLLHTFLHHELQAAELMAWAILAFPDAPERLRRGLLGILLDEVRHMNLYAEILSERGFALGAFEVRDWFWERVPHARTIDSFLATMGIGFEGANLDHTARFAKRFRDVGDERAAAAQELVGREEIPHVRFAMTWFMELSPRIRAGEPLFEAFRASLPEPLSPVLMRGPAVELAPRRRAGQDEAFLESLQAWTLDSAPG